MENQDVPGQRNERGYGLACVAGAKRGRGGDREKSAKAGKREGTACYKRRCFCIPPTIF